MADAKKPRKKMTRPNQLWDSTMIIPNPASASTVTDQDTNATPRGSKALRCATSHSVCSEAIMRPSQYGATIATSTATMAHTQRTGWDRLRSMSAKDRSAVGMEATGCLDTPSAAGSTPSPPLPSVRPRLSRVLRSSPISSPRCLVGLWSSPSTLPRHIGSRGALCRPGRTVRPFEWSGRRESNPRNQFGRLRLYH